MKDECGQSKAPLPGKPLSLWLDTTPQTSYSSLDGDISTDVAVVGGGIAGITTALMLKMSGKRVVLLELKRIAEGTTGFTTAKITSAHGLIYRHLISSFGEDQAKDYANANQIALEWMVDYIGKNNIDCDLKRMPAYTYAVSSDRAEAIEEEVKAARRLGLPVLFTRDLPLPFRVSAAIRFDNQAQFHPRKYLLALAEKLNDEGSRIFESTKVLEINGGNTCSVVTEHGTVSAENVVVATNFPIYDPLQFYARMRPRQSYVLGVRLNEPVPQGMFYSTEDSFHSLRPHPYTDQEDLLLVGGEMHRTGHSSDTIENYHDLEKWARDHFKVNSIEYRWSTHDMEGFDRVPFIGKFADRIYGATGFKGWGMTHGTVAGMIITDLIIGHDNPWRRLYDPKRSQLKTAGVQTITENVHVTKKFLASKLPSAKKEDFAALPEGEGQVIEIKGKKVAVYKDPQGNLHTRSAVCTHLGCEVNWNNAEKSWDCPCHGSRFDCKGKVIHAPAIKDLPQVNLDKE